MKKKFISKSFSPISSKLLAKIDNILGEYGALGYDLSLRQLYYQLVARDFIPNSLKSYKRIVNLVGDGRLAGLIPWDMITDRNRVTVMPPRWEDPAQIVNAAAQQFAIDKWSNQSSHVEVMVEKDALSGVLIPVCRELGINFTANKGYSSLSILYETGNRILRQARDYDKTVYVLYLGDHDPSGIDMTRDIADRLSMFSGIKLMVKRLALNYDQIQDLNPPENPAKETDSRFKAYFVEFGESCWELDAIEPTALADIVRTAVNDLIDQDAWDETIEREDRMKADLINFAKTYNSNGSHSS